MTSFFDERHYISGRPTEISPSGWWLETGPVLSRAELPDGARKLFESILTECRDGEWQLVLSGDIDLEELRSLDQEGIREEMLTARVTFYRVLGGATDVWGMEIRDALAPMNPAGHDFYARADGTYLGFQES